MLNRRLTTLVAILIWVYPFLTPIAPTWAPKRLPPVAAEFDQQGQFQVAAPRRLADGEHSLYSNRDVIGSFVVDAAAQEQAERQPGPRLDVARVVPYPADFADAIPDLGFLDGRFYSLDEEAARTAAAANGHSPDDVRESKRLLAQAGWIQRYESRLAAPSPGNPATFNIQISSFVVEYASATDAQSAFDGLTANVTAVESSPVGDESVLTLLSGITPDTKSDYQAARVIFRVGPLLGVIVYADLLNQKPDLALLISAAQLVAARGEVVNDRQTAPLGSMILQLDRSAATGRVDQRDIYDVRAGIVTPLYGGDDTAQPSQIDRRTSAADAFSSTIDGTFAQERRMPDAAPAEPTVAPAPTPTSVITIDQASPAPPPVATPPANSKDAKPPETEQTTAHVVLLNALYAFQATSDADAWLAAQHRSLRDQDTRFSEVTDGPALGDASTIFTIRQADGDGPSKEAGFLIDARVGSIVSVLEVQSNSGISLNGAARLMSMQVDCIDEGGCAGLAPLPKSIFGGVDAAVSTKRTPTPVAARTPAPVEAPAALPIEEPTPPPLEVPTPAPVEEPTLAPVEESTPPAVEEPTPPPVDEATPPPVEEPTPAPVEEATPPAVEEPTPPPVEESTPPPVEEATPPPVEEPTPVPTPGPETSGDGDPNTPEATRVPREDRKPRDDRGGGKDRNQDSERASD